MKLFRYCSILLLILSLASVCSAQSEKKFPTDDEINLLMTQADRAIQQYKPLIDQEEIQMGKSYVGAVANDRHVVEDIELAIKAFRLKPQAFNGPSGFAFFVMLDDADRNALLCSSGTISQSVLNKDVGTAERMAQLAQSCSDVSNLIYTVSENADALYQRYVEGEEGLAQQAFQSMQECVSILKKSGLKPTQ